MPPIQIRPFNKSLDIRFTGQKIVLPTALKVKVQGHWQDLLHRNPKLHNGEVFTVVSVQEDARALHIRLAQTDYAHYLYGRHVGDLGDFAVRIIHPAALVVAGGQIIFGEMGSHTSLAGMIQCCGGGIDHESVRHDGTVAIDQTMTAELHEELGLSPGDKRITSIKPTYLKFGGPTGKMVLIYIVELNQTSKQFLQDYAAFTKALRAKKEDPEFEKLFCISTDPTTIEAFIQKYEPKLNEYMPILLRTVVNHGAHT